MCVLVWVPTPTSGVASFSKPLGRPDSQPGVHQGRQCAEHTHSFLLTREEHVGSCVAICEQVSEHMCKGDIFLLSPLSKLWSTVIKKCLFNLTKSWSIFCHISCVLFIRNWRMNKTTEISLLSISKTKNDHLYISNVGQSEAETMLGAGKNKLKTSVYYLFILSPNSDKSP